MSSWGAGGGPDHGHKDLRVIVHLLANLAVTAQGACRLLGSVLLSYPGTTLTP